MLRQGSEPKRQRADTPFTTTETPNVVLLRRAVYYAPSWHSWNLLPEAIALVVAIKGLGRYPEIQAMKAPGAAERFIVGTLASILWAAGCALVAVRLGV